MPPWSGVVVGLIWLISSINFDRTSALRTYDAERMANLRSQVKSMFYHAYDSYILHAYPYDELRPLSCDGVDTWGSYSLTLIDALDTLAVIGNYTEFRRVAQLIIDNARFDMNINVSVFETNIRIVGGLLSAHMLSHKAGMAVEKGWPCNGPLLRLAEKVARKLLPAFDTKTGMPYGTVNLRYGVPAQETPITCTAGVGTFLVEFGALSRLTGDPIYEKVALRAMHALYSRRSPLDLFGNHIDTQSGKWTAVDSGIGAGVDSYFEYMVKGAILFQKPELMHMFRVSFRAIEKHLGKNGWYVWATMGQGHVTSTTFQSLEAYWPGLLSLTGEFKTALKAIANYHRIWKQYGALPELYNIVHGKASHMREGYPLRPELIESAMYLYRATGDHYMLEIGEDILHSIEFSTRTECGYATIRDVTTLTLEDRMESFFLSETVKYLYLLFDEDNFIHSEGEDYVVVDNPRGPCTIYAGGYIFNTEAHPVDPSALFCCSGETEDELHEEVAFIDELRISQPYTGKESLYANYDSTKDNLLKLHMTELDEEVYDEEEELEAEEVLEADAEELNAEDSGNFDSKFDAVQSEAADLFNKLKLKRSSASGQNQNQENHLLSTKPKPPKDVCFKNKKKRESDGSPTLDAEDETCEEISADESSADPDIGEEGAQEKEDEAETQSLLERLLKKLFQDQEELNQQEGQGSPSTQHPEGPRQGGLLHRLQQNFKLNDLDLSLGEEDPHVSRETNDETKENVQILYEESKKIEKMVQNFEKHANNANPNKMSPSMKLAQAQAAGLGGAGGGNKKSKISDGTTATTTQSQTESKITNKAKATVIKGTATKLGKLSNSPHGSDNNDNNNVKHENRIRSPSDSKNSDDESSSSSAETEPDLDMIFGTKGNEKTLSFYFSLKWLREFPELVRQLIPSENFDLQEFYKRLNSYSDEEFSRDFNFSASWLWNHRILKCPGIEMADRFAFFKSSVD